MIQSVTPAVYLVSGVPAHRTLFFWGGGGVGGGGGGGGVVLLGASNGSAIDFSSIEKAQTVP